MCQRDKPLFLFLNNPPPTELRLNPPSNNSQKIRKEGVKQRENLPRKSFQLAKSSLLLLPALHTYAATTVQPREIRTRTFVFCLASNKIDFSSFAVFVRSESPACAAQPVRSKVNLAYLLIRSIDQSLYDEVTFRYAGARLDDDKQQPHFPTWSSSTLTAEGAS